MIRRRSRATLTSKEQALADRAVEAWTDPGINREYHERMKSKVRAFMPVLAQELDALAKTRQER